MGARAMHIEEITGSLEPGKRADLITLSLEGPHSIPQFHRDPKNIYARIVYAAHQEDVQDVMVNGAWLMRDRALLTVDIEQIREEANDLASDIDAFLMRREESVLSKLIAIGGVAREKSFEVQVKIERWISRRWRRSSVSLGGHLPARLEPQAVRHLFPLR